MAVRRCQRPPARDGKTRSALVPRGELTEEPKTGLGIVGSLYPSVRCDERVRRSLHKNPEIGALPGHQRVPVRSHYSRNRTCAAGRRGRARSGVRIGKPGERHVTVKGLTKANSLKSRTTETQRHDPIIQRGLEEVRGTAPSQSGAGNRDRAPGPVVLQTGICAKPPLSRGSYRPPPIPTFLRTQGVSPTDCGIIPSWGRSSGW